MSAKPTSSAAARSQATSSEPARSEEALLAALAPRSFALAYRMLGSVAEAEDVVQEALLRVHRALAAGESIASPRAYAATITTRLALDELRSARARRERYVGDWLPEPLLTDGAGDPLDEAELADSLSTAMLVLLETLSPEQRAALLLHDVFDYSYGEVAGMLERSEPSVRQLVSRARRRVHDGRPVRCAGAAPEQGAELTARFIAAARDGELEALEALLTEDVVLAGDGGGRVPALARSLHGRARVARTLLAWLRAGARLPGASIRPAEVNGGPGVTLHDGEGRALCVMSFQAHDDRIATIHSVVNPDKLRHLGPVGDMWTALGAPG